MRVTMRTFQLAVRGLPDLRNAPHGDADRVADRQRAALRKTAGRWEYGRNTAEIIAEIEGARTMGREVPFDPAGHEHRDSRPARKREGCAAV